MTQQEKSALKAEMTPKQQAAIEKLESLPPESRKKDARQFLQLIAIKKAQQEKATEKKRPSFMKPSKPVQELPTSKKRLGSPLLMPSKPQGKESYLTVCGGVAQPYLVQPLTVDGSVKSSKVSEAKGGFGLTAQSRKEQAVSKY